jgi:trehalose/maltose transport system substrate-binding protein
MRFGFTRRWFLLEADVRQLRNFLLAGVLGLVAGVGVTAHADAAKKITVSCGSNGIERDLCIEGTNEWSKKTGQRVEILSTPNDSNERLGLYQQLLSAGSADVDLYQIDVVWPGILASHLLDLTPHLSEKEISEHVAGALNSNKVDGKVVALPWFMDGGVLYYRADLLKKYGQKVPQTWEEMGKVAKLILEKEHAAGNAELWGFVYQGRAYEGLTCNALEWVASTGGGTIVDDKGAVTINNPQAAKAIGLVASWVGKKGSITPEGVLSYSEEEARGIFQSGKSIFMRNWPYAWALLNSKDSAVKGKVVMTSLPSGTAGGPRAATLGGWSLGVSKYTKNPKEAVDLAKFLTGFEQQKMRAIKGSFNPTRVALYSDAEVLKANPHLKELKQVFLSAVPRPAGPTKTKYNRLSAEFWNSVHAVLSQAETAESSLKKLEARLAKTSNGGKW